MKENIPFKISREKKSYQDENSNAYFEAKKKLKRKIDHDITVKILWISQEQVGIILETIVFQYFLKVYCLIPVLA